MPNPRSSRGQGLVEFAVIFPIFAFLLFAVVDGGLLLGRYNNINNSAKEGARLGSVAGNKAQIIQRIQKQAHGALDAGEYTEACGPAFDSTDDSVICVQWVYGPHGESPGVGGSAVRVKIKYQYDLLTPLPNTGWGTTIDITVCAIQRLEQSMSVPNADKGGAGDDSC